MEKEHNTLLVQVPGQLFVGHPDSIEIIKTFKKEGSATISNVHFMIVKKCPELLPPDTVAVDDPSAQAFIIRKYSELCTTHLLSA